MGKDRPLNIPINFSSARNFCYINGLSFDTPAGTVSLSLSYRYWLVPYPSPLIVSRRFSHSTPSVIDNPFYRIPPLSLSVVDAPTVSPSVIDTFIYRIPSVIDTYIYRIPPLSLSVIDTSIYRIHPFSGLVQYHYRRHIALDENGTRLLTPIMKDSIFINHAQIALSVIDCLNTPYSTVFFSTNKNMIGSNVPLATIRTGLFSSISVAVSVSGSHLQ